ncbi:MAG: GrpB family protein, partial [Asgard group archaeon]|nr:GrpB family protein [Asgard group archaeon]
MNEPIIIEEFDPNWEIKYKDAKNRILEKIGQFVIAIEHIGSTAISCLASKPIIDILIGLHSLDDAKKCIPL